MLGSTLSSVLPETASRHLPPMKFLLMVLSPGSCSECHHFGPQRYDRCAGSLAPPPSRSNRADPFRRTAAGRWQSPSVPETHTTAMLDRRVSGEAESVIEGGVEEGCESAGRQDHLRFRDTSGVIDVRGTDVRPGIAECRAVGILVHVASRERHAVVAQALGSAISAPGGTGRALSVVPFDVTTSKLCVLPRTPSHSACRFEAQNTPAAQFSLTSFPPLSPSVLLCRKRATAWRGWCTSPTR